MSFTDDFTGADGSSPSASWTQDVTGWQIQSNRLEFRGASFSQIWRTDGSPGDQSVEWDMDLSNNGFSFALFGLRVVDANNYVYFQLDASDILTLHTWVAGVDSGALQTDSVARCGSAAGAVHCRIQFVGDAVSFIVTGGPNPGTFGPFTVSDLAGNGAGCVFGINVSKNGDYFDNVVFTSSTGSAVALLGQVCL